MLPQMQLYVWKWKEKKEGSDRLYYRRKNRMPGMCYEKCVESVQPETQVFSGRRL